jgi:hypothetical protein
MRSGAGKQAIKTMLNRAQKEQSAPSRSASAVPPGAPTPGRRFTTQPSMRRGCRRCKYSTTYLAHRRPKYRRRATLTTASRGHGSSASRTRMHLQTQTPTQKSNGNANDQTAHPRTVGVIKDERMEVAEMIEQYIDYVDDEGRSVHLPMPFVRHYMRRDDNASPSESPPGCHRRIASGKACSDRGES